MAEIALTGRRGAGKFVIVNDCFVKELSKYSWNLQSAGYAQAWINSKHVLMHRYIWELAGFAPVPMLDHRDRDKLNNRIENLRPATRSQNQGNRKRQGGTSKYTGVYWYKRYKKWRAYITINGKKHHIDYFDNEVEAAKAYDKAAKEIFGEFANLNFPEK